MFKQFNEQNKETVKELFSMFADRMLPAAPAQSSNPPAKPSCSKASPTAGSSDSQPTDASQPAASSSKVVEKVDCSPVIVNTPPKQVVDLTTDTEGAEKECPPKNKNGREKECSSTDRRPRVASVITKVEPQTKIRDLRRNLKRKSESDDSDHRKSARLDLPGSARALAEINFQKVESKRFESDHQLQRRQFTEALIKPPVWFPMDLSLTAYLVVRFLFVHEKARYHARMHSDKGQNFQQYRKPFHHYGIKAAEIFDAYAHKQHINMSYSRSPNLKAMIPWFREWPKQRLPQLTPHCTYYKNQKTVSLRTNTAFFETHLKKLGGKMLPTVLS